MTLPFRLLALDIDGTLLNSRSQISARDLSALRRVRDLGAEVALCTGRRHRFAMPIAKMIGWPLWLCTSNGAIIRSTAGETLHRDMLPAETAIEFCRHMEEFRRGMVLTFDTEERGALVIEHQNWLADSVSRWMDVNAHWIAYSTPLEAAIGRIRDAEGGNNPVQAMVCGTLETMAGAEKHLMSAPFGGRVTVLKTEYPKRDLSMLDVVNAGCSKGHAVERLARHFGVGAKDVMAIGDNYNDKEMLEFAGIPMVMGNASEQLKGRGWMVTRSNDEDGVAAALQLICGAELLGLDAEMESAPGIEIEK